jgi:putative SOS response-associated peptidase YedK
MCFSVNVNLVKEELENRYGATFLDPDKYSPSYYYHAFGLPEMAAICSGNTGRISVLRWGLIPSWVKDRESADEIRFKTFNARSESVDSKASFSFSFRHRRCIIPVKGFFEWQSSGKKKIPWYIYRADNEVMSLAGLWSEWTDSNTGELISTFSVITTEANDLMADIHNSKKRMPSILERKMESQWLDLSTSKEELMGLLKPYPAEILKAYTIGDLVNDRLADRNTPDIIKPFSGRIENTLF